MQKGHSLSFPCTACSEDVTFDLRSLQQGPIQLHCKGCKKPFVFEEGPLLVQIRKFLKLVEVLKDSEDILSMTSVAIRIGEKEVQIPYKLLLTRLTSNLEIEMEGKKVHLLFRSEPAKD